MAFSNNVFNDLDFEVGATDADGPARVDVLSHQIYLVKLLFDINHVALNSASLVTGRLEEVACAAL